ncbi:MAG TPA: acyl-CoA dehydrogenase [Mycobacteriales bacterium]|nr:acyl-CoA dehydrogenase [Mycobacteriales bacterium]
MDVRLSAEQRALRETAVDLVDALRPQSVIDLSSVERATKLDAALIATGWRTLREADEDGAPYASAVEVAIVAEELGRGLADTPFIGPTLAADLRRLAGAPPADGAETIALTSDLGSVATAGRPGVAIDAAGAPAALVCGADGLYVVALGEAAVEVDLTRPQLAVTHEPTAAAVAALPGDDAMRRWTALGLALSCADLVGVMRGATTLAADYAKVRKQYGAEIGSYQAVQHLLADAFVAMEGSRSAALHAAWAVDALPADEALAAAAGAKAYCARAARSVCETSIQVHGGIGNTWECLAHVYLRRALVSIDLLGGVGPSLERVLDHNLAGAGHELR